MSTTHAVTKRRAARPLLRLLRALGRGAVWCAIAALLGLILPGRIFPQESQPVSLYALASSDITDIEEKLSWQDAKNGWSVAPAPAGLVPSGGEEETPSGNRRLIPIEPAQADEPAQVVVERRVRGRNWYHAYALEHAYIQPTAVFAQLATSFEVSITAGAEGPRVRLVPRLHYGTGTYDGDVQGKEAALEVRVPRGQCLLAKPSEALAKRLLDLLVGEDGIFLLCGVSGESASAEEPSTGKR
ncbi:MAG: hypothetical protein JSV08_04585 [Acidobacteriota bacterium]|nr:MAG: hypothetical protein JSV08_04585 [Acidobacteriota bacterium]